MRIYIKAEVELHIDVPDDDPLVKGWDGSDDDCPNDVRDCMNDALTVIQQRSVIDIGWPDQNWTEVWAEVTDTLEVRGE